MLLVLFSISWLWMGLSNNWSHSTRQRTSGGTGVVNNVRPGLERMERVERWKLQFVFLCSSIKYMFSSGTWPQPHNYLVTFWLLSSQHLSGGSFHDWEFESELYSSNWRPAGRKGDLEGVVVSLLREIWPDRRMIILGLQSHVRGQREDWGELLHNQSTVTPH